MTWWEDFNAAIETKDYPRIGSMINEVSVAQMKDLKGRNLLHYGPMFGNDKITTQLINAGCDVNAEDLYGETPLMVAVEANNLPIAKLLLEAGADHTNNNLNKGEFGPLHMAVWYKFQDMVKILLEAGADVNILDEECSSPLHIVAKVDLQSDFQNEDRKVVTSISKLLIDAGADIDAVDFQAKTPLHWAIERRNYDVVNLLLNHNAEVDVMDDNCTTPLHWVVRHHNFNLTKRLLHAGAYVDSVDCHGMTSLHYAVKSLNYPLVQLLLESGATPNITDDQGYSPLHWAVREEDVELIKILINKGADVNIQDDEDAEGLSALQVAAELGFKDIMALLIDHNADVKAKCNRGYSVLYYAAMCKRIGSNVDDNLYIEILKLLLARGADIDNDHYNIKTPFNSVLLYGNEQAVRLFIEHGVDLNKCILRKSKISSLHHAALNSDNSVLKYLIDSGHFDIEEKCGSGLTALHLAAFSNQIECIKFLLKRGANINADNVYGETPLYSAIVNKHSEAVRLLLANGADINIKTTRHESILGVALESHEAENIYNIIKHIALLEAMNKKVSYSNYVHIRKSEIYNLQNIYEKFRAELVHMKECVIFGSITIFNILTDKNIGKYARNQAVIDVFNQDIEDYFPLYRPQLCTRFSDERDRQKLIKKAMKGLSRVLRCDADTFHVVFYNILDNLGNRDLQNLAIV